MYEVRINEGEDVVDEGMDLVKVIEIQGIGKKVNNIMYYPWDKKYEALVS